MNNGKIGIKTLKPNACHLDLSRCPMNVVYYVRWYGNPCLHNIKHSDILLTHENVSRHEGLKFHHQKYPAKCRKDPPNRELVKRLRLAAHSDPSWADQESRICLNDDTCFCSGANHQTQHLNFKLVGQ